MNLPAEKKKNVWKVSDTNCVYLCPNVLHSGAKLCTFGICKNCYFKNNLQKRKRRRDPEIERHAKNGVCMHKMKNLLVPFFDKTYFVSKYKQSNTFVDKCHECKAEFIA